MTPEEFERLQADSNALSNQDTPESKREEILMRWLKEESLKAAKSYKEWTDGFRQGEGEKNPYFLIPSRYEMFLSAMVAYAMADMANAHGLDFAHAFRRNLIGALESVEIGEDTGGDPFQPMELAKPDFPVPPREWLKRRNG